MLAASLLSCVGQLCQKQAACLPPDAHLRRGIAQWLLLACFSLGLALLFWLNALQQLPVGVAYPMLSLNVVWVTLAARWIWQEPVGMRHATGLVFIVMGVMLLGDVQ